MFIGIERLAANALIEILEKTGRREVDFETLVKYGRKIVRILHEQSGKDAVLLLSRKYQISMVENYPEFFEAESFEIGIAVFRIKETVTVEELSNRFRWTMSVSAIKAFMSEEAIQELGVAA